MATYTAEAISAAGTILTPRTAASGDKLNYDTNTVLRVINGSVGSITLTIPVVGNNSYGQPNPDPVITVAAGATKALLVLREYIDSADGLISLTWSATADVTFIYERH
ncbi:hypothetical protein OIE13_22315 [Streptosporangium sp. NBC_01810]|uniref:hypothetical protein n=1 Tax=Streptosporangium sp. NBC_01810 TaxID=2975951 RepID=UPI002DDBC512|nr:hypothetical protein [Streptosporangium sp. NBC_01810]WSA23678.1 hypothetical protein OIE13_22315 [Streptosporangium sp. NBC_01810]